ncbi:MAG: hypothetical protein JOY71_26665 [Acetobacteraceae bacterium]|nr:hypothetical protein [Acetobacteraceae bacterium]MBV8525656.1 hypothetical protein [Acetobacteraceae bacterium]MBV8592529.1 hypothetical protein [Acetobacteraceae bacterium]
MRAQIATAASLCLIASVAQAQQKPEEIQFALYPNPNLNVVPCLAADGATPPKAIVKVRRGELNDRLRIRVRGLKPHLAFDLFTVQRSPLDAQGGKAKDFTGSFGLAWYQTDLQADDNGNAEATIQTILLDQIFGFDPDVKLPPTNTFHVGFWFNNPEDAAACGFDPTKPTPFNGEHRAGPLAMISQPTDSGLGPLCTSPTGANPDDPNALPCNP